MVSQRLLYFLFYYYCKFRKAAYEKTVVSKSFVIQIILIVLNSMLSPQYLGILDSLPVFFLPRFSPV